MQGAHIASVEVHSVPVASQEERDGECRRAVGGVPRTRGRRFLPEDDSVDQSWLLDRCEKPRTTSTASSWPTLSCCMLHMKLLARLTARQPIVAMAALANLTVTHVCAEECADPGALYYFRVDREKRAIARSDLNISVRGPLSTSSKGEYGSVRAVNS